MIKKILVCLLASFPLTTAPFAQAQQPIRFELVVNLKTAKQIGVTIPQWTLMKATKVIQ